MGTSIHLEAVVPSHCQSVLPHCKPGGGEEALCGRRFVSFIRPLIYGLLVYLWVDWDIRWIDNPFLSALAQRMVPQTWWWDTVIVTDICVGQWCVFLFLTSLELCSEPEEGGSYYCDCVMWESGWWEGNGVRDLPFMSLCRLFYWKSVLLNFHFLSYHKHIFDHRNSLYHLQRLVIPEWLGIK